jgi:hypothetical protein
MLSVTFKHYMLSVVMLNVVILSAVAPITLPCQLKFFLLFWTDSIKPFYRFLHPIANGGG